MAIDDKLTDLMAARLSKRERLGFDLYESKNHLFVLFLPINLVKLGTITKCYFCGWTGRNGSSADAHDRESWRCRKGAETQLHYDQRWSAQQPIRA